MKSFFAVAAFLGLVAADSTWGPHGTWTNGPPGGGSWGTSTGGWGTQKTWTPSAWTSAATTHVWNATTRTHGGTGGTGVMSTGAGSYPPTGSPIATGGVDSSKPMIGGLLAVAGVIAAL